MPATTAARTSRQRARQLATRHELWRRGQPSEYLCDVGQRRWLRSFRAVEGHHVWKIGRQRGKTHAALTLAIETCLAKPGAIVRYAAKTGKSAAAILLPTMKRLLADCPAELLPRQDDSKGLFEFPNGSVIVWAGTDNEQFDRLRGPYADLILLDESAFYSDLESVEAALLPQLLTTGGKVLYLSTPPLTPGHLFNARRRAAQGRGAYCHDTIEGNPRLGPGGVERVLHAEADRLGMSLEEFRRCTYCRREYYAEDVIEETRAAVPGWNETTAVACTGAVERPQYFDAYTSLDWGGYEGDPHAALFAWLDFPNRAVVVVDELERRGITLPELARLCQDKEREHFGADRFDGTLLGAADWSDVPDFLKKAISKNAPRQPYLRVSDKDEQLQGDLLTLYGYACLPADKHNKHLHVDTVDVMVRTGRLRIHPRCVRLLEQLGTTIWNERRTEWERTEKDHGDLVDCLIYMVRHIRWNRNPNPPPPPEMWGTPAPAAPAIVQAFGRGGRMFRPRR